MKLFAQLKARKLATDETGLSLIEMIVAIVVLGIVAVGAYPLLYHSLNTVSLNNTTTAATVTVQDIIEKVRAEPTCVKLNNLAANVTPHKDARGKEYTVKVELPEPCVNGKAVLVDFTVTQVSSQKQLLQQKTQIFVPPLGGEFVLSE